MKRPSFVKVISAPMPRAGSAIEGVRVEGEYLEIGTVVPVEWFQAVSDEQFEWMLNDLKNIQAHDPDTKEMLMLQDSYPAVFAERDKAISPAVKSATRKNKSDKSSDEGGE